MWAALASAGLMVLVASSTALAQTQNALRPLAIPEGVPISCDTLRGEMGRRLPYSPQQRNLNLGGMFDFGAERRIEAVYDSTGLPVLLMDATYIATVDDMMADLHLLALTFASDSTAQGTHITRKFAARRPGEHPPASTGAGSPGSREVTAEEVRDARKLATWIWDHACR